MRTTGIKLCLLAAVVLAAAFAAPAAAHVERSAYWPDPAPDCSIHPCAGGRVPPARSLASALRSRPPGRTRVVCTPASLRRLRASVARARRDGFFIRPTVHRTLSAARARRLLRINRRLFARCAFHEIQPAVTASHNNDRVVIMPGLYTEPTSAAQPTHDPACKQYLIHSDTGDPGALSHSYQIHCPNDANLIAVIGRGEGPGKDPDPARPDRHGIPNLGPCIRCNLQIEGSGVSADDVVVEAGDPKAGNGGPSAAGHRKDVGVFVDRADGFVLRNLTVRHATEHDIYILETDGYRFERFKTYYAGGYGVLTFVEDHGLMQNCEAAGNGDSGLYPGAGAKTSAGRDPKYYPTFRYSQEIRYCDSHHNDGGYSGTDGNGTHVDHNNFYDNALGFTTDVFTSPGHPGFPQQGDLVEDNNFYDNNFNPYLPGSDVRPDIAAPVGTGLWIAGGDDNIVRNNHFYDNWRRGVMLFAAPDSVVCGPAVGTPVHGCDPTKVSTSYRNQFYGNTMGVAPDGKVQPNGTDFWWDSYPDNTGNCWYGNHPAPGRSITTSPLLLPDCSGGKDASLSIGTGDPQNEGELVACLAGFDVSGYPNGNSTACSWTQTPAKPGSSRAAAARSRAAESARDVRALEAFCALVGANPTCAPLADALAADGLRLGLPGASLPDDAAWLAPAAVTTRPLGLYTCASWRAAGPALRRGLLARLHRWVGGAADSSRMMGYGAVLPDDWAAALFGARCGQPNSDSIALYRIYGPAAAFAGVAP